jgi:hypothetical protein
LDSSGTLYGTTRLGGHWEEGTIFQLTHTESGWIENVLYPFFGGMDGQFPVGGLVFDRSGNLYGTASIGGYGGGYGPGGTVVELTSDGWQFVLVYELVGNSRQPEPGPQATLVMDTHGVLYGTTTGDGATLQILSPRPIFTTVSSRSNSPDYLPGLANQSCRRLDSHQGRRRPTEERRNHVDCEQRHRK